MMRIANGHNLLHSPHPLFDTLAHLTRWMTRRMTTPRRVLRAVYVEYGFRVV
ncbi:MAG TPA: hypothetical protein VJG32_13205 [Anaerolineae bacterium]|nr:hypothetical protein [Anaerolineae bacterium]